jgi:hypothetical protein
MRTSSFAAVFCGVFFLDLFAFAQNWDRPRETETSDSVLRQFIPSEWNTPAARASGNIYRRLLDSKTITLDAKQRFAVEKCLAEALFAEGNTAEAKRLWSILRPREAELVRETLNKLGVSDELSQLYRNYRKEQDAEISPNRNIPKPKQAFPAVFSPAKKFFVAPQGKPDDKRKFSGTESDPFSTLTQARDALRKLKTETGLPKGGVEIIVRGGVYPVAETFTLEACDSGAADSPIVYRAFPGEKPVFSGGVAVRGLNPESAIAFGAPFANPSASAHCPLRSTHHKVRLGKVQCAAA